MAGFYFVPFYHLITRAHWVAHFTKNAFLLPLDMNYLVFFFIINLLLAPTTFAKSKRHRVDQTWKSQKKNCEKETCSHLQTDVNDNCVNECVDPLCYDDIYTQHERGPLEDGEIDADRYRMFINCVRKSVRERRQLKEKQRRKEKEERKAKAAGKPVPVEVVVREELDLDADLDAGVDLDEEDGEPMDLMS